MVSRYSDPVAHGRFRGFWLTVKGFRYSNNDDKFPQLALKKMVGKTRNLKP